MNAKSLGILLYIDATPNMLEEFSWIYKSWIYSGNWRTSDIIAVCNPLIHNQLPDEPGVIKIPIEPVSTPTSKWANYPFINSIACLCGPHIARLAPRYSHFLRTDADVFLTRNLVNFRPNFAVHGRGRYAETEDVQRKIVEFARKKNLLHHHIFNCGVSLLAGSNLVTQFVEQQYVVTDWLLDEFKEDSGQWPGWCVNVITLYASEIVANNSSDQILRYAYTGVLDYECVERSDIDKSLILHIHAIPTYAYWSKYEYRRGLYKDIDIRSLNRSIVPDYCHWICETPTETVKDMAGYGR